ncbi:MAG TPA: glycoside hydrolase family 11 protein [Polyangia bacterium]|jgi:hypothetical protein|nr:glycoside hydrolase family 11 protein [Polyangia bacterium]
MKLAPTRSLSLSPSSRITRPRIALLALCVLSLGAACLGSAEPTEDETGALTGAGVTATLSTQSDWGTGYCDLVTITNTGAATTGWQVVITLNSTYSQSWNATVVLPNGQLSAASLSWNGALPTNGTASFGFCGTSTSATSRPALLSVTATRPGGAGGTTGSGGTTGTGGAKGSGGTTGAAGTGSGGTSGTGGAKGGSTGSGGAGSGGTTGTGGTTSAACTPGASWTGGKTFSSNSQGNVGNGYSYQYWSNGVGSGSMTVAGVDAKFSATWSNAGDFLARVGLGFNSTKTPAQIGTVSADFAETKTGGSGGFSYVGIYGWSENPLHEYYIVEDWFGSRPVPGTKVGTITVDGGAYDVYTHTQTNQPAITGGNQTFVQFFSVRQTARQCGQISISQHFSQWASLGLQLGNLEEARLLVEAGNNSGSINFTTATVTVTAN